MTPADIASWFGIRSFFRSRIRKYAGTGVPHIVATLRTIGAAIATAASASERDQPPTPRLSIGMFSSVQPIKIPPTNAFALTASQSHGGVSLVRTLMAAAKTITAKMIPPAPCQIQNE